MHLYFYCFSDETIHVASFCGKEFGFLQSDDVVFIEAVFSYCRFVRLGQSDMSPMLFYPKLHFTQRFCHCWKHFVNSSFRMSNSVFVEFHLMSSAASNRCPFRTFLSLGNRKKSHGVRSGEYGGCCNWAVPCLAKNCCTRCEVCAGALSWCRIQSPSCHFSGRFRQTDSCKRRKTSTYNSLLIVCPSGAYSWCTIPSESKNGSNITFVLLRTWCPFFGRRDVGPFHCDDCCFVSGLYL